MDFSKPHIIHAGSYTAEFADAPNAPDDIQACREKIEPWLSAVFQSEHLSLLIGNGFTSAVGFETQATASNMSAIHFGQAEDAKVDARAAAMAFAGGRGEANIEDQLTAAIALLDGLEILGDPRHASWKTAIDTQFTSLLKSILATERGIEAKLGVRRAGGPESQELLVSFLLSFASRAASRERLHIFTTNYDRLLERGCDLAGLRVVDRFAGAIEPQFRSSRMQIDLHYTSPGTRSDPRHLEGVVHLTKLHGSLDWRFGKGVLSRVPLAFGAPDATALPANPRESVVIYPNAAKDVETAAWPYADLFRDFSTALCRPNSVLVTYGYGFGDSHVNRIIADMLTLPSTHVVIIAWGDPPHDRIRNFLAKAGHKQQVTLILGKHLADFRNLVESYLPKPAIDPLTLRMQELLARRGWRPELPAPGGEAV